MKEVAELRHLFVCVFMFNFSAFMVIPALTDITMAALCPGEDECSFAIYLSGFHQAVTGLGTLLVTPIVGNLSDKYGRKALLTLPMTIGVIPIIILAYSRTRMYFYAYYGIKMLTGMFCEGSMQCLSLAYVADKVCERRRASMFGALSGVSAAGFVLGTVVARFLPTATTFQASAAFAILAAAYMRAFLKESDPCSATAAGEEDPTRPLCPSPNDTKAGGSPTKLPPLRKLPSIMDMINLLRSSLTLTKAALINFFCGLGESGMQTSLLYFLKAQFHFNKDQFANMLLIIGIAGAFSQLLLMPFLTPLFGEEKLLTLGLLAGCVHVFLYSISWASWVPYFACSFILLSIFVGPCLRSIVSKEVGPDEQGMAQGCITGISSVASILSPLVFSPLTAIFLSDDAPFNFKGFSIMCAGFPSLVSFILSVAIRHSPSVASANFSSAKDVPV